MLLSITPNHLGRRHHDASGPSTKAPCLPGRNRGSDDAGHGHSARAERRCINCDLVIAPDFASL